MIERHWKGIAKMDDADRYIDHLTHETFPHLSSMPGFVRASILKRQTVNGMEFLIITVWKSLEDIKQFAGETIDEAVVPVKVQEMMVTFDAHASHYEVVSLK
jgi:heme-degrading monooxygenase HmoA